jgi:hypothetical protein
MVFFCFLVTKQKKIEIVKFMIILLYKTSKEITIIYVKVENRDKGKRIKDDRGCEGARGKK